MFCGCGTRLCYDVYRPACGSSVGTRASGTAWLAWAAVLRPAVAVYHVRLSAAASAMPAFARFLHNQWAGLAFSRGGRRLLPMRSATISPVKCTKPLVHVNSGPPPDYRVFKRRFSLYFGFSPLTPTWVLGGPGAPRYQHERVLLRCLSSFLLFVPADPHRLALVVRYQPRPLRCSRGSFDG